jgi:hypothetical protein
VTPADYARLMHELRLRPRVLDFAVTPG